MFIIGVTGGTGAGKTTAVQALKTLGALALDCDEIYHEMLLSNNEMREEIEARFKDVSSDGKIDRHKLSEIVWSDAASLCELNMITHRVVGHEVKRRISEFKAQGGTLAAIDAIALIESGQGKRCNMTIGVTAPMEERISRIMKRDNLTRELAQMRINAQQPESYYKENCDHILENIYDTQIEFEKKCIEFFGEVVRRNKFE